jgi:hypothetical protein
MAVVEGYGTSKGQLGTAVMCLDTPGLFLSGFSDNQLYARLVQKVQFHNPRTIIYPEHRVQAVSIQVLRDAFPDLDMVAVSSKYCTLRMLLLDWTDGGRGEGREEVGWEEGGRREEGV